MVGMLYGLLAINITNLQMYVLRDALGGFTFNIFQILMFCKSDEFKDIQLRVNEKRVLNTLNKDKNRATIRSVSTCHITRLEQKHAFYEMYFYSKKL